MPTRNVVLTQHQQTLIESLVESGRYQNASEVMREGLRLVERREGEDAARIERLRGLAREGIAAIDRGDFQEFTDARALVVHLNRVAEGALAGAGGD